MSGQNAASGGRVGNVWTRLLASVRQRGLAGMLRRVCRRAHGWWLERQLGIRTSGSIHADELGSKGVRFGYQPIDFHSFETAITRLDIGPSDVFADYGCGMGRAVVLAACRRFRRVIGVELSRPLCEIAAANLQNARQRGRLQTADVEVICADATEFETPDDLSVLFLYNPFAGDVLREAMERVRESLQRHPRRLQIVYALPRCDADALASIKWLRRREEVATENSSWERLSIYENCEYTAMPAMPALSTSPAAEALL